MENLLAPVVALTTCSGWAAVVVQWWSQCDDWTRAKFIRSLEEWRAQVEQTRILYDVAEELAIALGEELGVSHETLKRKFREESARKFRQEPVLDLLEPWCLRTTLRKIESRKRQLDLGQRFRVPRRGRASLRQ